MEANKNLFNIGDKLSACRDSDGAQINGIVSSVEIVKEIGNEFQEATINWDDGTTSEEQADDWEYDGWCWRIEE